MELWDLLDENGNATGEVVERGKQTHGYHLVVHVWIVNSKGEFLISKRTPNKLSPNMWECTGGSAVAGDDSITTAMKEVSEELGVTLNPENGRLFTRLKRWFDCCGEFVDVWIFRQDVDLRDVVYQEGETCDAMLATKEMILQMMDEGTFIQKDIFPYIDELFVELTKWQTFS